MMFLAAVPPAVSGVNADDAFTRLVVVRPVMLHVALRSVRA